jgi:hypothetical protein
METREGERGGREKEGGRVGGRHTSTGKQLAPSVRCFCPSELLSNVFCSKKIVRTTTQKRTQHQTGNKKDNKDANININKDANIIGKTIK